MSEIETFNEKDLDSIETFASRLANFDDTSVTEEFLAFNLKKTIEALKEIKDDGYNSEIFVELLRILQNITFLCRSENLINTIIDYGLHSVCSNIIDYELKKTQLDYLLIRSAFGSLTTLTLFSQNMAIENVKWNLHVKGINLLNHQSFAGSNNFEDDQLFVAYDKIINFFEKNSSYQIIKEALVGIQVVTHLSVHLRRIENAIKGKRERRFIKLNLITTIANLLNDHELDTMPITQEIVTIFIDTLKEMIEMSETNEQVIVNSKFYTVYVIDNSYGYLIASRHVRKLISIAVNDTIKQKLFEGGILPMLETLLKKGNETEIENTTELLCSLCFNENVAKYVKSNEPLLDLIKKIQETTNKDSTKQSTQQIITIINSSLQKRITSAKTGKHIMISYNHKYKEQCLKINEQLINRGYKTWMDVNSVFTDLHDAMAEAIERALVVLVCYSYEYKTSNNCRLEAQYAFKLNKTIIPIKLQLKYEPDGWLGMILASKLYIDFSKDIHDSSLNTLYNQIDSILAGKSSNQQRPPSAQIKVEAQPQTQERPPSRHITSASRKSETNPRNWTNDEVMNWLKENHMTTMMPVLKTCRGATLKALHELKQKDYTQFCSTIEKEIEKAKVEVDTFDKLNFYEYLQCLFK